MNDTPTDLLTLRKNEFAARLVVYGLKVLYGLGYLLRVEHGERLSALGTQGAIIIPKHQSNSDPPFESIALMQKTNRTAYYLMKGSLPKPFARIGGIPVQRMKEMKQGIKEGKYTTAYIREYQTALQNTMYNILAQNETLIMHPEGTRNYKQEGTLQLEGLKMLLTAQEKIRETKPEFLVPFVPVAIEYERLTPRPIPGLRTRVTMTIGEPITARQSELERLVTHLAQNMNYTRNPFEKKE